METDNLVCGKDLFLRGDGHLDVQFKIALIYLVFDNLTADCYDYLTRGCEKGDNKIRRNEYRIIRKDMDIQPDGSLRFCKAGQPIFIFGKKNYDFKCSKHPLLKEEWFLKEVEETLFCPDVITQGISKEIRIYYKVIKSHNTEYDIWVDVVRVPLVYRRNKKGGAVCFIKSAYDRHGFSDQIIHFVEKRICEKQTSLI